jgi:NADH-quinone oxidoreductase subunit H
MGSIQRRVGPNIIGFYGLLQPIIDGIKLVLKENIIPIKSNNFYYLFAPIFTFFISLIIFIVIPFNFNFVIIDINNSILFIFALSTLSIYGVLYGG